MDIINAFNRVLRQQTDQLGRFINGSGNNNDVVMYDIDGGTDVDKLKNLSNILPTCSGVIPMPKSLTDTLNSLFSLIPVILISLPFGE